jgi:hypothetical protein
MCAEMMSREHLKPVKTTVVPTPIENENFPLSLIFVRKDSLAPIAVKYAINNDEKEDSVMKDSNAIVEERSEWEGGVKNDGGEDLFTATAIIPSLSSPHAKFCRLGEFSILDDTCTLKVVDDVDDDVTRMFNTH